MRPVDVTGSPEAGYRLRARLHVRDGRAGFFREGTHALCDAAPTGQLHPDALPAVAACLTRARAARRATSRRSSSPRTSRRPSACCISNHARDATLDGGSPPSCRCRQASQASPTDSTGGVVDARRVGRRVTDAAPICSWATSPVARRARAGPGTRRRSSRAIDFSSARSCGRVLERCAGRRASPISTPASGCSRLRSAAAWRTGRGRRRRSLAQRRPGRQRGAVAAIGCA